MLFSSAEFRNRVLPITASQGVGVLCGIVGIAFVSRLVPPYVLGGYGVFLTFTTLGMWLVHLGIAKYLNRQWASSLDRSALLRSVAREWTLKLGWLALAAAGATGAVWRTSGSSWFVMFVVLFVSAAMLSVLALAQAALQADRAHWADFVVSAVMSFTRTFLPPLLYWSSGKTQLWIYLGFLLHAVIAASAGAWMLRRHWASNGEKVPYHPGVEPIYLGPLFTVLAAASWMLYGLNRWAVAWSFGEHAAGLFTLGSNVGTLLPTVLGAIALQYFQPGLYSLIDVGEGNVRTALLRRVDQIVAALGLAGLSAVLLLRWAAPLLIGTLIKETYADALRWIIPSGCFILTIVTNQFFHVMLLAARRERACAIVDLASAGALTFAALLGARAGQEVFWWALTVTPLTTWLLTRTIAHAVFPPTRGSRPRP